MTKPFSPMYVINKIILYYVFTDGVAPNEWLKLLFCVNVQWGYSSFNFNSL